MPRDPEYQDFISNKLLVRSRFWDNIFLIKSIKIKDKINLESGISSIFINSKTQTVIFWNDNKVYNIYNNNMEKV